jgi:anion transporter
VTLLTQSEFGLAFATLGDSIIWLMLASFIIAEAVAITGLSNQLIVSLTNRARSVSQLLYFLTLALFVTAFIVPSTSGRAALALPIFLAVSSAIPDKRVVKAIALLFPTIILLSAFGSLTGAGAHLVAVEFLVDSGSSSLDFGRWAVLGVPFALISSLASTWVILRLFLTPEERNRPLSLTVAVASKEKDISRNKKRMVLGVIVMLIGLWCTETLHGLDCGLVALVGVAILTLPNIGVISLQKGLKNANWNIILFMAATMILSNALIETGVAEWMAGSIFSDTESGLLASPLAFGTLIAIVSLLAHLFITSRTARVSVLLPLIIPLAQAANYDPTVVALITTAATGFCLTLPVSAKPVAMFNQLDTPTYEARDLLRLSSVLLPLHFVLLIVFAFTYWPAMGKSLVH